MKLTLVSHASMLIESGPVSILTDPWFSGDVFNDSWSLLCPPALTTSDVEGVTHIWISHEHPDHLHFPTLRAIAPEQRSHITLLYQRHFSSRVYDALRGLGFGRVVELPLNRWYELGDGVSVMCCSATIIDSLLAVRSNGITVLNLNDCVLAAAGAQAAARRIGKVDVMLTQFSIAGWVGNPGETKVPKAEAILERVRRYVGIFKPKIVIPFASFVYFSHEENRYMNDWINTPDEVSERLSDLPAQLQFLYNGDSWSSENGFCLQGDPLRRHQEDFEKIPSLPYRSHPSCPLDELLTLGQKLTQEVRSCFPRLLLWWAAPIDFYLTDQNIAVRFNLRRGAVTAEKRSRDQCDLALHSQALWYAFKFPVGFGTLEVSGRYEQIKPKVNKLSMYLCQFYAADIHLKAWWRRLLERRVWGFCWSKREEVFGVLLNKGRE